MTGGLDVNCIAIRRGGPRRASPLSVAVSGALLTHAPRAQQLHLARSTAAVACEVTLQHLDFTAGAHGSAPHGPPTGSETPAQATRANAVSTPRALGRNMVGSIEGLSGGCKRLGEGGHVPDPYRLCGWLTGEWRRVEGLRQQGSGTQGQHDDAVGMA